MNLNPDLVRQCIANLLLQHPELFDDDEARLLSIESETPAIEYLSTLEQRRQEAATMAGAIASRIAELELRQERFVKQEKGCRSIAYKIMEAARLPKVVLPEATYSITKGRERVEIADEGSVPPVFCHPPVLKPDMKKIKAALDTGERFNWATVVTGEPNLSVRTK